MAVLGDGMNKAQDESSEQFTQKYDEADFLSAIGELEGYAGTANVADIVGCPRRMAYNRLMQLREAGHVEYHEIGNSFVWTHAGGERT